jgi:hypothetical protein
VHVHIPVIVGLEFSDQVGRIACEDAALIHYYQRVERYQQGSVVRRGYGMTLLSNNSYRDYYLISFPQLAEYISYSLHPPVLLIQQLMP